MIFNSSFHFYIRLFVHSIGRLSNQNMFTQEISESNIFCWCFLQTLTHTLYIYVIPHATAVGAVYSDDSKKQEIMSKAKQPLKLRLLP